MKKLCSDFYFKFKLKVKKIFQSFFRQIEMKIEENFIENLKLSIKVLKSLKSSVIGKISRTKKQIHCSSQNEIKSNQKKKENCS